LLYFFKSIHLRVQLEKVNRFVEVIQADRLLLLRRADLVGFVGDFGYVLYVSLDYTLGQMQDPLSELNTYFGFAEPLLQIGGHCSLWNLFSLQIHKMHQSYLKI
jgi:hypothetical protein